MNCFNHCVVFNMSNNNHKKTIENIQILPKIADQIQKMLLYLQGYLTNRSNIYNLARSNI